MRYMFLIYLDEDELAGLDRQLRDDGTHEMLSFAADLAKRGRSVAHLSLEPSSNAIVVRSLDGMIQSTPGSALRGEKCQLRWAFIVEASDEGEAKQLASKLPIPLGALIQVRPVTGLTG